MTTPSFYGLAVLLLLLSKFTLSLISRPIPQRGATTHLKLTVVITVYNEDPNALRVCLESLLSQTYMPHAVVVVDDASTDPRAYGVAKSYAESFRYRGVSYEVMRFVENLGKRHGLAAGFNAHPDADVYLGVDSDTELDPEAIREGMKPFGSPEVTAVTGLVMALNARRNLLTRLIDLRYVNAFMYERAAYSLLGSVLCCCGSLAFYRGDVVRANLDDFLNQRFLGAMATFGDDRRLTNYCLKEGRVVLQSSSKAWTLVPYRFAHYVKQQVRWNKSFFRESLWVVLHGKSSRPTFWLTLIEVMSWVLFTVILTTSMIFACIRPHSEHVFIEYGIYVAVFGYARSIRYLGHKSSRLSIWEQVGTFALAPLYGLLNITVLLWVRVYALCTLRDNDWGTRGAGVEVEI